MVDGSGSLQLLCIKPRVPMRTEIEPCRRELQFSSADVPSVAWKKRRQHATAADMTPDGRISPFACWHLIGDGTLERDESSSSSQMTCNASPKPSSSTEASVSGFCGPLKVGLSAGVGRVLGRTSVTIHCRDRTLMSWPCSGTVVGVTVHVSRSVAPLMNGQRKPASCTHPLAFRSLLDPS